MAVAAGAGWLVGRLHDGSTLPMTVTVAAMIYTGAIAYVLLIKRGRE